MRVNGSPSFSSMCPISLYAASPVGARYAATSACTSEVQRCRPERLHKAARKTAVLL